MAAVVVVVKVVVQVVVAVSRTGHRWASHSENPSTLLSAPPGASKEQRCGGVKSTFFLLKRPPREPVSSAEEAPPIIDRARMREPIVGLSIAVQKVSISWMILQPLYLADDL